MKNATKKILSIVLAVMMLIPMGISSSADIDYSKPFRIICTVNGDTKTQRGFTWYTATESATEIEILKDGLPATFNKTNVECIKWDGNYMHQVLITGLEAGTEYNYRVGDGAVWSEYGSFHTDDGDNTANFVVIADVQAGNLDNFKKGSRAAQAGIDMLNGDVDALINLGDFTNDSTNEEWDYYAEAFDKLDMNVTLAPIAGNHDGFGQKHWFKNMFNLDESESVEVNDGVNYSYDIGNVHVAVLNTNDIFSVSDAQLEWLRNDMKATKADWKIVTMHKSPYTLGKDGKWPDALYLQQSLTKVCDECDVDLILSGHDHQYLRTKTLYGNKVAKDGSIYILCGTAGSKRYSVRPFSIDNFTKQEVIDKMVSQNDGYYYNGTDFDSQNDDYKGSCFNTIQVVDGKLTFTSYIINDLSETVTEDKITKIDTFSLEKETGKNKGAEISDNTTSKAQYSLGAFTTVINLLQYIFLTWLPNFIKALPAILKSVIVYDVF